MHDQIHRMTKLATDLLDLSKLDTGSVDIQMEQVDLCKLAQAVAREFDPQAANEESEVTVTVPDDLRVTCDPDRTAQIIRILVDNALHHTPDGTAIEVAAREEAGERSGDASATTVRASPRRTSTESSTASTPATRPAAPVSDCRSPRRWRGDGRSAQRQLGAGRRRLHTAASLGTRFRLTSQPVDLSSAPQLG